MNIRLIVGLGNPGKKYEETRHNAGFLVVNALAELQGFQFRKWNDCEVGDFTALQKVYVAKPLIYMNNSGLAVRAVCEYYKIKSEETLVVFDDFSLPLGKLRLRKSGSAGGHNGVSSIIENLGTDSFVRLRLGIGPLPVKIDPADYVLSNFSSQEKEVLGEMVSKAADTIKIIINDGFDKAVSHLGTVQ